MTDSGLFFHARYKEKPKVRVFVKDGLRCALVPLTKGQWAVVDAWRLPEIVKFSWNAQGPMSNGRYYATRRTTINGKSVLIYMHRELLSIPFGDKREGDHVHPNWTLDNRESNLRLATRSQNMHNTTTRKDNRTGLKGAFKNVGKAGYHSKIITNKKLTYLGNFKTPEEAHAAYCDAAKRLHQKFARVK